MDRSLCEGDGTPDSAGKPVTGSNRPAYDLEKVRRDFPILASRIHGHPLVYLDTAASAQKPRAVIDAMTRFIEQDYANVHRGVHSLAERATEGYEGARARVQRFLNARKPGEIVFTAGATAALNLVAGSWGAANLKPGDRVVLSALEHHSNIVPWQLLRDRVGIEIAVAPVDDAGALDLDGASPADRRALPAGRDRPCLQRLRQRLPRRRDRPPRP